MKTTAGKLGGLPGDGIHIGHWTSGAVVAGPSGAPRFELEAMLPCVANASRNGDFAAFATRLKLAHDSVAGGPAGHADSDASAPARADLDKLWATWQGVPGQQAEPGGQDLPDRQDPPNPAAASATIKPASVEGRARGLLNLVAAKNESAYEELYRLLSRRVYAFVWRMVQNAELADEIMMDTMFEVWRTAGRYRGDSRVTTWILGIARKKVLMAMRNKPTATHEDIDDFAEILDSEVPDGYTVLAQKETRELIQQCLQGLSEKHRECIHLTHFEDMSMPEVAAALGIPLGTVKSRLSHARAQLATRVSAVLQRTAMY